MPLYIRAFGFIIVRNFYFIRAFRDIFFIISLQEKEGEKETRKAQGLIAIVVQANSKRAKKKGKRCRQRISGAKGFLRDRGASL